MNLFKQFATDPQAEKEGVRFEIGVNSQGETIAFQIARAGGQNVRYAKSIEAKTKPYRMQIQAGTIDPEIAARLMREVFAESVVIGWEGVEDENGRLLTYSPEAAATLFEQLPELYALLQEQAQNVALYRKEVLDNVAKN